DGNRTRLHGPARPGRAEPPRAEGRHPDSGRRTDPGGDVRGRHARQAVLLGVIMQHTNLLPCVGDARRTEVGLAVGMVVTLGIVGAPRTAHAQIDPLAIIKRNLVTTATSPTFKTHLLVAVDTSLRMQFDADGNYYDPYDYS